MATRECMLIRTVLLLLIVVSTPVMAAQSPQIPLPANPLWMYQQPLPLLSAAGGTIKTVSGNGPLTIRMCEFQANVLPAGAVTPGVQTPTWVWGYLVDPTGTNTCADLIDLYDDGVDNASSAPLDTFTGPVILNQRGPVSTDITWINDLGNVSVTAGGVTGTNVLAYAYSLDQTMHWADPNGLEQNTCVLRATLGALGGFGTDPITGLPLAYPPPGDPCAENYSGWIPAVPHLHGGEVPAELDGGPDAWFTGIGQQGHAYYSAAGAPGLNAAIYKYPNTQEAAPVWFHDHVLGATRLNVFAGLAGAYLIYDPAALPAGLHSYGLPNGPGGDLVPTIPLVIQDRMFDTNGQLFYTTDSAGGVLWATNPEHPYWTPEFLGDAITVNGKVWPFLNVEPKRYRFWLINGSNARTYEMYLIDPLKLATPPNMWVIATDGGYLDTAVMTKKLVMMPGERYEVIIDFNGVPPGTNLVLKNTAKTPYPAGVSPKGATTGQIMQFRVGACGTGSLCGAADTSYNPAAPGAAPLRADAIVRLPGTPLGPAITATNVQQTRQLTLNEVMGMPQNAIDPVTGAMTAYPGGPLEILVNNTKYNGTMRSDFLTIPTSIPGGGTDFTHYSELPNEGETEVWEIVNLTADAHPIHLHMIQFQIIDRQNFDFNAYNTTYQGSFPGGGTDPATGTPYPPGVFMPGYGPPLDYNSGNPRALGGNPDIAAVNPKNGKPLYLSGKPSPPLAQEAGWKDTVVAFPSQVTRIAARWAPTDILLGTPLADTGFAFEPNPLGMFPHGYVWHCHIIDHEDNEMMRPFSVQNNGAFTGTRTVVKGTDY